VLLIGLIVLHPHTGHAGVLFAGLTIPEMRDARAKLIHDARAVLDKADTEKRGLTPEEVASQTKMLSDARDLGAQLRNAEELEVEERGIIPESQREERRRESPELQQRRAEFRKFTTSPQMPVDIGDTISIEVGGKTYNGRSYNLVPELRAQNTLSLGAGGAVIAPDTSMYGRIVEAIKWFGGVEAAGAEVLTTDTGADMPIATDNDTSNSGVIVAEEGSQASGTSVTMGSVTLHAYLFSSKVVKVSWQLLQDASFDIENYMGRKLGMRLGRALNTYCTTGTGVNQPQG
jgi:HK97 family phage major capsid protein